VLRQLAINPDSQLLVFSKTSVQAPRISPSVPRAIYFNDDTAIGYVPGSSTLEVASVDAVRGPIFYTVSRERTPAILRGQSCLRCHHGPNTAGVAGVYVGSVLPGPTGRPLVGESAIISDHRTPFADRWGGWYVTATRGEPKTRANAVAASPADPATLVRDRPLNLASIRDIGDPRTYPSRSSDIVALMTFEHQTQATNLITRLNWEARLLAAGQQGVTRAALDGDIDDLVAYLLFEGETPLPAPIEGTSTFSRTFPDRGPRDRDGRSLRDFDLRTRLFRYRLSYTIYSRAFDALPDDVRTAIYASIGRILSHPADHPRFAYLSPPERTAIIQILRATKHDLPPAWPAP